MEASSFSPPGFTSSGHDPEARAAQRAVIGLGGPFRGTLRSSNGHQDWTLNASVSSESMDVPAYQPSTDRRPPISRDGEVFRDSAAQDHRPAAQGRADRGGCHRRAVRHGGEDDLGAAQLRQLCGGVGGPAVDVVHELPRRAAPLSLPRAIAAVRNPIRAAYWTPRWPSPPRPRTATVAPGRAPLLGEAR